MNNFVFEKNVFPYENLFTEKVLHFFSQAKNLIFLNSNNHQKRSFIAISNNNEWDKNSWQFGFITYDYKNKIEALTSNNSDYSSFSEYHFFTPQLLFIIENEQIELLYNTFYYSALNIKELILKISNLPIDDAIKKKSIKIKHRIAKQKYINTIEKLKKHIQLGDIYEINFCQEFFAEDITINPIHYYFLLNKKSPTPFSCFVKHNNNYLLCASPERFIKKQENTIISQPIKGTKRRGISANEDVQLKNELISDPKERSENIMIVDLVRNDLAKVAKRNSVTVEELCGIYSFAQVHQLISTIKAELKPNTSFETIIKALFPMGSMTGAPKMRAMQLIEQYESIKRGIYSGTVGYISPNRDFDFNVVIRSITYNAHNNYLSFLVGGAITSLSNPENEYEECLLKAKAMMEIFEQQS